jgi:transcriptional regulator with XRE-family HTH domain
MATVKGDPTAVARIGRRIARRREQLGLTQSDLAKCTNMSEAYVSRLENGIVRNPKVYDLARIARALDLALVTVLFGDAPSHEDDVWDRLARQPRLAGALTSLVRGFQWAGPEDRDFVMAHLESLATRFGAKGHSDMA